MGPKPRVDAAGLTHHVVAVGNAHGRIVRDDIDRMRLISLLAQVAATCRWECQAYCLMDTHLHLVVHTREATLGTGMRNVLGAHARRFNQRHRREGHVWAQKYFARPIDAEAYLSQACA
jgi:REP-associated tyrosine transposase